MCGLMPRLSYLTMMMGLEFRPTFWINIYNRVRLLDFPEAQGKLSKGSDDARSPAYGFESPDDESIRILTQLPAQGEKVLGKFIRSASNYLLSAGRNMSQEQLI